MRERIEPDFTHGGNVRQIARKAGLPPERVLDFSASLNPLGFPDWLRSLVNARLKDIALYPDPEMEELIEAFSERTGVPKEQAAAGAGATELIFTIPLAGRFDAALIPAPSYTDYRRAALRAGLDVRTFRLDSHKSFALDIEKLGQNLRGGELVFLGHPNNPTGKTLDADALRALAREHSASTFLVDESFGGFVRDFDSMIHDRPPNVIVVLSLTKLYAVPGLRLGMAVADDEIIGGIRRMTPPWPVNTLAQAFGAEVFRGDGEYERRTVDEVEKLRRALAEGLERIGGLTVFPGETNYLLVRMDTPGMDARRLSEALLAEGIAVRLLADFEGLDDRYFRVAVRTGEENEKLLEAVAKALGVAPVRRGKTRRRKIPAVMFQGTGSDSGKSVLAAAMLRVLARDGFRAAPFKAQNMALNSYVTLDGREIGRAQATQAQAAGLEPDTLMNPILLKPNSDTGAQVIVLGEPVGSMTVDEYFRFKKERGFDIVKSAYDELTEKYDVIVMEGAGSPAEVNLKDHDIVNMRMARHAGARAVLVGDIDRGGVFASFIGCAETMAEWERRLLAGFIVNKFRGDARLLGGALDYTSRRLGMPALGVVPYMEGIGLPEEDRARVNGDGPAEEDAVTVAVVRLRRTSNFTDFDPLMIEPDVSLRLAERPEQIEDADAVVIPGSKSVIPDLLELERSGMAEAVRKAARGGKTMVIGLCGGFQMLGRSIADPGGVESSTASARGLGLLDVETSLAPEKTLARARGRHAASGLEAQGYEIHHGETALGGAEPLIVRDDGAVIGAASPCGLVWGTYLHGLFDRDEFRRWLIDRLREKKGLAPKGRVVARHDVEERLDRLAEVFRESVGVDDIYRIMGLT
ncbi:MAG: cobyric acid synthase [Candidatus Nitrospinota bacterium M3_3B_026]